MAKIDLEVPPEFRPYAAKFMWLLENAVSYIREAENPRLAAEHVAYACGLTFLMGASMGEAGEKLGVSKQAVSKGARRFCLALGLEPSNYMQDL